MGLFDFLKKKSDEDFGEDTGIGGMQGTQGMGGMPQTPGMQGTQGMGGMPQTPGMQGTQGMGGMPQVPGIGGIPRSPGMNQTQQPPQLFGAPEAQPQGLPPPIEPTPIHFYPQQRTQQQADSIQILKSGMDVLSSKMDSLKAAMDRINERLDYIEKYIMRR